MSKLYKFMNTVSLSIQSRKLKSILFFAILAISNSLFSQVTISGGSTANGSYATISDAITALNGSTISAPVVVDVTAGLVETAPVGGIVLTATGTVANTITIQKSFVFRFLSLIFFIAL